MKAYIVNPNGGEQSMLSSFGFEFTTNVNEADLVLFCGGEDVTPSYYGEPKHGHTFNNELRDRVEKKIFESLPKNVAKVGICRGAQFLNVMSGGKMYQHVTGHTRSHDMVDHSTGELIHVSSTHHQMMLPSSVGIVIATAVGVESNREWFENQIQKRDVQFCTPEVVFYPNTNCLCVQGHPEFNGYADFREYFKQKLVSTFNLKLD